MKRMLVMFLIFSMAAVSSLPLLHAGMGGEAPATTYCPLCHMSSNMPMASMQHTRHVLTPAMRHCRIECCGHHNIDGLPHLLAPHAVSLAGFGAGLVVTNVAVMDIPVLKPLLLPFPVPPPRFS